MNLIRKIEAVSELGEAIKEQRTTLLGMKDSIHEFTRVIRKYPDFEHGRIQQETERMIKNHIELMKKEQEAIK